MAIVGLLLNILVLPGLGTIVAGQTKTGVIQLVVFLVGALLSVILIGIPIAFGAWVWALVSSIQILKTAQ